MKRVGVILFLCLFSIVLVSAFSFGDFFDKFTGNVVGTSCTDTDTGLLYNIKGTTTGCLANGTCGDFEDFCVGTFELNEYSCNGTEVIASTRYCNCETGECVNDREKITTEVKEGWNLVPTLVSPNHQINGGDIMPSNIRAIYQAMPVSREYINIWEDGSLLDEDNLVENDPNLAKIHFTSNEINMGGYDDERLLRSFAVWLYSDIEGTLEFDSIMEEDYRAPTQLIEGWNFIGILPSMFNDSDLITLNNFRGNCDFLQAHFIDKNDTGQDTWIPIDLDEVFDRSVEGRGFIVEVLETCIFGEIVEGTTCTDTDGGYNRNSGGTVNLTNSTGTYFESDSCVGNTLGQLGTVIENECFFYRGEVKINKIIHSGCNACNANGDSCNDHRPESDECIDFDSGKFVQRSSGIALRTGWLYKKDVCYINGDEVDYCEGTDCFVKEYFCNGDSGENEIISCESYGGICTSGMCGGKICVLKGVDEITCTYQGIDYFIEKQNCNGGEVTLNISYEGNSEILSIPEPGVRLLSNGMSVKNRGAPCSIGIVNLEIVELLPR